MNIEKKLERVNKEIKALEQKKFDLKYDLYFNPKVDFSAGNAVGDPASPIRGLNKKLKILYSMKSDINTILGNSEYL